MRFQYLDLSARVLAYRFCHATGKVPPMPISLALSLTNKCNSQCKTCNIWRISQENHELIDAELTAEEWDSILESIGPSVTWFTLTGGEPMLRDDLIDICSSLARHNRPRYLNLATSGIYPSKTTETVKGILSALDRKRTTLTVNVSIDEIGKRYDSLRGVPKGFEKVQESVSLLKGLKKDHENLNLGTNIVLSRHNADRFEDILLFIDETLRPDSLVCEIGAKREAFRFRDDITIPEGRCVELLDLLLDHHNQRGKSTRVIKSFRNSYYRLMRERALGRGELPCFAGYASAEISSTGEIWNCSVRAESMGSLRDHGLDFQKAWHSGSARDMRKRIRKEGCSCTGANPNYTNLLCSLRIRHFL